MKWVRLVLDQLAGLTTAIMAVLRRVLRWTIVPILILSFSLATVSIPALFNVMSSLAAGAYALAAGGPKSDVGVRKRHQKIRNELAAARVDNTMLSAAADFEATEAARLRSMLSNQTDEIVRLRTLSVGQLDESSALRRRVARIESQNLVSYGGRMVPKNAAVSETAEKVSRRVTASTTRNISSMAAEALPWIGIGVVVTATTWEVKDACELMKDLHELDVAFNPENAIDEREVCGMQVPTRDELWRSVKSSPGAAWDQAAEYYASMRAVSFEDVAADTVDWSVSSFGSVRDWIAGDTE